MPKTFSAQVDAWVRKSQGRMTAVFQTATQMTIEVAQEVGPSVASANAGGEQPTGGLLPVDTGFLRASGQASLNGWPVGPSRPADGQREFDVDLVIAGARIGDVIHWGWTAAYARAMEERYGFNRSATGQWRYHVEQAIREAKRRFP